MEINVTFWKGSFSSTNIPMLKTILSYYHSSDQSVIVDYGDFIATPMDRDSYVWIMKNIALQVPNDQDNRECTTENAPVADNEGKKPKSNSVSPILKQYIDLKAKHPDALLLFRCSDFYETYMDDAEAAAKTLGITLTKSNRQYDAEGKPLAMAGFPYHALDAYLPKLIRAGHRVAICDQIEEPKKITKTRIDTIVSSNASEPKEEDAVENEVSENALDVQREGQEQPKIKAEEEQIDTVVENSETNIVSDEPTDSVSNNDEREQETDDWTKEQIIEYYTARMIEAFVDNLTFDHPVKFKNGKNDFQANNAFLKKGLLTFNITCLTGTHQGRTLEIPSNNNLLTRDNVLLISTAMHKALVL